MRKLFALVFLSIGIPAFCQNELTGKVVQVVDGNTIEILTRSNERYTIVLAGIDCPELNQEYGDKAKRFLEKLVSGEVVEYEIQGKDRKGNYLAVVTLNGEDPRIRLLEEGLAWTAERNPDPALESYRMIALEKSKGLWKEEDPTPPWIFRRQQTMLQPKSS